MKHIQTISHKVISTKLVQSKDVHDYKDVFCLTDDFGDVFLSAILTWCGLMPRDEYRFWEVYLVRKSNRTVGVCGLYSLFEDFTKELWLGWFGIVPSLRSKGIGSHVIYMLIQNARMVGCTKLYSYVDKDGAEEMKFYERIGFKRICSVGEYIDKNKNAGIDKEDFMSMEDHVIFLDLNSVELSVIEI